MDQIDLFVDQFTFSSKFNCRWNLSAHFSLALGEISPLASQRVEVCQEGCEIHRHTNYLDNQVVFQ